MMHSILAMTPVAAFGEAIRHSLEDTGRYRVRLAASAQQARSILEQGWVGIAILDGESAPGPVVTLAHELENRQPGIQMVIIPPDNNPRHPTLVGLGECAAFLQKPFYRPALITLMDELVKMAPNPPIHWITSGELNQIAAEADAYAVLVANAEGQMTVGGPYQQEAAPSMKAVVDRFWRAGEKRDAVQYLRLEGSDKKCLIYLHMLDSNGEVLVGMVFSASARLSQVRGKIDLALPRVRSRFTAQAPAPELSRDDSAPEEGWDADQIDLAALLGSIPSPDPEPKTDRTAGVEFPPLESSEDEPVDPDAAVPADQEKKDAEWELEDPDLTRWFAQLGVGGSAPALAGVEPAPDETQPQEHSGVDLADTASFRVYTCVMLPRPDRQPISAEMAELLPDWASQLCQVHGWKLIDAGLNGNGFQWTVELPADVPASSMVEVLRERTSDLLFNHFDLARPSGEPADFWQENALVMEGDQPGGLDQVQEFIAQAGSSSTRHADAV